MSTKRVSPAIIPLLREALTLAYWYKPDLRAFLTTCLPNNQLISQLDWTAYKRTTVKSLVDTMAAKQDIYFEDLLSLLLTTAEITDPSWLKPLEDGADKYQQALNALDALRGQVEPYRRLRNEADEAERRREIARSQAEIQKAMQEAIEGLRIKFQLIVAESEQKRGYSLEKFLNRLFEIHDIDSKASFKLAERGQQIDGAFSFDGTEFLVEAKWQKDRTPVSDLMIFAGKVRGKLDNTLGLFISMNGYESTAVKEGADGRPVMILMDGGDLSAVLEQRIDLRELLKRKRQHASRTGETFISAFLLV